MPKDIPQPNPDNLSKEDWSLKLRIDSTRFLKLAYDALLAGNKNRADSLYNQALSANPGLIFIGMKAFPDGKLERGDGSSQDTRVAMQFPEWFSEPYPDQSYYWTPEWQAEEREADKEIAEGLGQSFSSVEELMKHLEENLQEE